MSFAAFHAIITSADLRQVAAHWDSARAGRTVPAWKDIRPAAIVRQLPIVWSYTYDAATDTFTGRLAGDVINQIFGRDLRGVSLSDLQPQVDAEYLGARFRRVVTEVALYRSDGAVFHQAERHGFGERIIMPLSEDGVTMNGIFGATQYQTELAATTPLRSECEAWFPLLPQSETA